MEIVAKNNSLEISKVEKSKIHEVDFDNIPFGRIFTDHMFVAEYENGEWVSKKITPYGKISVFPCITALHYGQAIFEGMKALLGPDDSPLVFRPLDNHKRFNLSAERLCMPPVPEEIFMEGLNTLIEMDKNWIPKNEGGSLYLRPFYFSTDEYVGIRASEKYKFMIFACPVGAYYAKPVKLMVCTDFTRAFKGGTGEAKAAGNYAASLIGAQQAKENGCDQAIWLDGNEKKYIEECGTMNIFFVIDGTIVTPELDGTILRGITRASIIQLAKDLGFAVEERRISVDEIVDAHKKGKFQECFGTGTAATIASVESIKYGDYVMDLAPVENHKISRRLKNLIMDIKKGNATDNHNWVYKVK